MDIEKLVCLRVFDKELERLNLKRLELLLELDLDIEKKVKILELTTEWYRLGSNSMMDAFVELKQ